jgi:hypothetical protein
MNFTVAGGSEQNRSRPVSQLVDKEPLRFNEA